MPSGGLLLLPSADCSSGLAASGCSLHPEDHRLVAQCAHLLSPSHPEVPLIVSHCSLQRAANNLELAACRRSLSWCGA